MWQTYDGYSVVVNETGFVMALEIKNDGSVTEAWNYSLNMSITSGAIDNSQHRLALGTDSGVKVISTEFHELLYTISILGGVDSVGWDGNGDLWVGDRTNRYVAEYDDTAATGVTTQTHLIKVTAVLGMANGSVVSGGRDSIVRVSAPNGSMIHEMMDIQSDVEGLYLIDNGDTLVTTSTTGQLITYSTSDWQKTGDIYLSSGGIIRTVEQNTDGTLIVGTHNGHLKILNSSDLSEVGQFSSLGEIIGVKLGHDTSFFLLSTFSDKSDIIMFDLDSDGDGVVDAVDEFPDDSTQQIDTDGDGYGDNQLGNNPDKYPLDETQWLDSDGDGRGDNASGNNGDLFPFNPTQYQDSDGDGYGDNPLGQDADAFPNDVSQWLDTDGDQLGDNPNGTNPDDCPTSAGNSYKDRNGCSDSDNDGYSDPRGDDPKCSSTYPNGADAYPQDATQWCDTDDDNFGDNLSGNNPDWCPAEWGNSTRGIFFNSETNVYVTIQRFGCIDNDGDGYEDSGEQDGLTDWSTNKSEWVDSDRDGVGDNADWDDLDPTVNTLEEYCVKNPTDYSNCESVYVPVDNSNDEEEMTASEKRSKLIKEFLVYGGGIGVALIAGILAVWGLVGIVRTSIAKRAPDAQYSHQDATKELQAFEEGEEFKTRGGITEQKGWEDEKLGDGVTEDELWDLADEIEKPSAVPDSSKFTDEESSSEESPEESDDTSESEPEPEPEPEPVEVEKQPTPDSAATTEMPDGAPPLPEGGLPAGWTTEQWVYYGHQWWDAKNKQ
uniref:Uncharacterized protein n=1 Tax=uncultured marine group II/III euryarchaeote KM3_54_F07 TaxID=1456461 RepID=A0A075HA88_9EURY|nr:hypothetical protein [uncultured marine group II/III euryarchaeote KM3_54_F07]